MRRPLYKLGRRLSRVGFVRSAIDDKADLSGFDHKPTFTTILGVFLIAFSFVMGWPAMSALASVAAYFGWVWVALVGPPLLYGFSHLMFMAGMALSGAKYSRLFLRWLARVGVEKLLSFGGVRPFVKTHHSD